MYYPCSENKGVISFAVTAKLICAFVFALADCWFSHAAAHLSAVYKRQHYNGTLDTGGINDGVLRQNALYGPIHLCNDPSSTWALAKITPGTTQPIVRLSLINEKDHHYFLNKVHLSW